MPATPSRLSGFRAPASMNPNAGFAGARPTLSTADYPILHRSPKAPIRPPKPNGSAPPFLWLHTALAHARCPWVRPSVAPLSPHSPDVRVPLCFLPRAPSSPPPLRPPLSESNDPGARPCRAAPASQRPPPHASVRLPPVSVRAVRGSLPACPRPRHRRSPRIPRRSPLPPRAPGSARQFSFAARQAVVARPGAPALRCRHAHTRRLLLRSPPPSARTFRRPLSAPRPLPPRPPRPSLRLRCVSGFF